MKLALGGGRRIVVMDTRTLRDAPAGTVAQGKSAPGAAAQAAWALHSSDGTVGCPVPFLCWYCTVTLHCAGNVLGYINVLLLICSC